MTKKAEVTKLKYGNGYTINMRTIVNLEAKFAEEIMIRLSLISAKENGEDSAGRQKLRTLTDEEVVQRACNIAELAYREFEKRDWLIDVPSVETECEVK